MQMDCCGHHNLEWCIVSFCQGWVSHRVFHCVEATDTTTAIPSESSLVVGGMRTRAREVNAWSPNAVFAYYYISELLAAGALNLV